MKFPYQSHPEKHEGILIRNFETTNIQHKLYSFSCVETTVKKKIWQSRECCFQFEKLLPSSHIIHIVQGSSEAEQGQFFFELIMLPCYCLIYTNKLIFSQWTFQSLYILLVILTSLAYRRNWDLLIVRGHVSK